MNQTSQTLKFVIAAAVMVALASATHFMTQPKPLEGYGRVGESFFPDLDPSEATALQLISYNEDTATIRDFSVKKQDGVWTLPSYYNYPADGEDQLAKTTTSLVGIKRGALVSRSAADHERFGVIDPMGKEDSSLKGRGQRLIIFKDDQISVADLIIGKEVPDRSGEHYVRVKDETDTWICTLDVELSTKFGDWVEADLLKMERDDLTKLEAVSTVVGPEGVSQKQEGVLTREKSADPWALDGLNEETEEVNTSDIGTMVTTLDNLKLTGIRRRPRSPIPGVDGPLLLNDLTFNVPEQLRNNPDVDRQLEAAVQQELSENGFLMYRDPESGRRRLLSQGGELIAATNEGVEYHLHFGSSFTGTEEEIEIGKSSSKDGDAEEEAEEEKPAGPEEADGNADEEKADEEDSDEPETTESRYLFVRAVFNEALLGEKPVEPVKPVPPEGVEVDDNGDVVEPEAAKTDEKADAVEEKKADDDKADDSEKAEEEEAPKLTPVEIYKKEIAQYRTDVKTYESDLNGHEQKVKDGQEAVDLLNERFADWYYVISAEDFGKLRLSRDQLVKEKEKPAEEASSETESAAPAAPADAAPAAKPAPSTDPAPEKPAAPADAPGAKPAADAEKPADAPAKPEPTADGEKPDAAPAKPTESKEPAGDSQ
jgi:hypothetical protein